MQAGVDLETGKVDIDKIKVGITKSQREKINEILDIIKELEKEYGTARETEIIERAEERGISKENVEELIEKLRRDGNIFEPKHENYKVV
jgi:replicative DNA helicase Mcm